MMRRAFAALGVVLAVGAPARAEVPEVRFARQYSMGYLQFNVIEHEHLIQKHAAALGIPEVKVSGVRFNGPASMNDALISDSVDIVGGSPNGMFTLWAKARGTPQEVRAITALVTLPYMITSNDPEIRTIADLGKCRKIPVPSVRVSSPAVTLQMAAARLYGIKEYNRFDAATVTMSPADATVALLTGSGDVNCVMALPPYMQQQLEHPNIHVVASSFDLAGGPTTYTVAYTSVRFHDRNPKLYQAVYEALNEATEIVRTDVRRAARYWIEDSNSKLTEDFVTAAGSGPGTEWTTVPLDTMKQAAFMAAIGTIKVKPASWKDYFFPEAYGLPGS
ncbi:MAG TPA: nitrate ABC transporter substrate-binding protein [Acetobacteraceae bacterium]|jgi:NitT/TauT family transport system substrate-binding protein|nr:nitrate ABC transporter substrate-binding protein [Acetobacteraceae bacterium]